MTFDEYKTAVEYARRETPEWRMGQAAFNVLMVNRPDLSEQIRATNLDPFHRNDHLPRFYEWIEANWEG